MPDDTNDEKRILADKNDEYFLAIGKQGVHSFLMLGVVRPNKIELLARIGKIGHSELETKITSTSQALIKGLGSGFNAVILSEPIAPLKEKTANERKTVPINYQAYSITYDQVLGFLSLINQIEQYPKDGNDHSDPLLKNKYNQIYNNEPIQCYVPDGTITGKVKFVFKPLRECKYLPPAPVYQKSLPLAKESLKITMDNTCRTTAKSLLEHMIGIKTDISKYFFIAPRHKTNLIDYVPEYATFYILPSPPISFDIPADRKKQLDKLYKRMTKIAESKPELESTRKKFDALKGMYKLIAGENTLTAEDLLQKIVSYESENKSSLHGKRQLNFFSSWTIFSSTTEKLLAAIKSDIQSAKVSKAK